MMGDQQESTQRDGFGHPAAVEVHGLDAAVSLLQLRQLFNRVSPVLQAVAALDTDSQNGVALVIFNSPRAAASAVELFDGCPLGNAYLHVKPAQSLPNSLINMLYSLDQSSSDGNDGQEQAQQQQAAEAQAQAQQQVQASVNAAAAFIEQQHQFLHQEQRRQQQEAWDQAVETETRRVVAANDAAAAAAQGAWAQLAKGGGANGHQNGGAAAASAQQQRQQLEQLGADLLHLQMDQQQQAAAAAAGQQRQPVMSWASAAAAPPSLASLRQSSAAANTVAAALAAAGGISSPGSGTTDEWQTAATGRGRQARRGAPTSAGTGSSGRATSSVSSGSPRAGLPSCRRSEDKAARPGGQDGASADPTTKLWMGGIDGSASADTVRTVFGRYGAIYDYELQPATHEKGRTDQWGFVNYKKLGDANAAYEALVGEVIPELTGTRKLKLQFRPVDNRRPGGSTRR